MEIYEKIIPVLKEILDNVGQEENNDDLMDLQQDILLSLIENKKDKLLERLESKGQLKFYLSKIVTNQIRSTSSPYFYKYKKPKNKLINIEEYIKLEDEGETTIKRE